MRKHIFTLMALAAALCACNKEQIFDGNQTNGEEVTNTVREPLVFTATMEGTPGTKATLADNTPNWEVGDQISINGFQYKANAAGLSTTFSEYGIEVRPTYVSGSPFTNGEGQAASMLVDEAGTSTKWCDKVSSGIYIIVATENKCKLNAIRLWNGGDTQGRPGRRWKDVKVYGSSTSDVDGSWELLKSFQNLDLAINNNGFAGELPINSSKEYKYYKVEVLSTISEPLQQMSDMKFVVSKDIRPTFVSTSTPGHYGSLEASMLVDDSGTTNEWCTPTSAKVDGVWNIVVSTGSPTILKTIKLWNARNTEENPGRTWKKVQLYGRLSSTGAWEIIKKYDNLDLEINNRGFAGELDVNAGYAYTFYRIDVLENAGDEYMQMSDMKFTVDPEAPYYAYFPASLFDGFSASLPSAITETWVDGKFNMPMYAQSNTTNLEFKNICGVLKITVKKDYFASVKSIRVSSSNKATSGEFTVSNNAAVLALPDAYTNTVTVTYANAVATTDEGTVFYVAIPAQTYRNLKIELSSDGNTFTQSMTTKKDTDIVVARNKIYPINFVYATTGEEWAFISMLVKHIKWVQLWAGGPKWAMYNVGVTTSNVNDGKIESYGSLLSQDDPYSFEDGATQRWGPNWRTPTRDELQGLIDKCTSEVMTIGGIKGRKYTGKGIYSKNSIFLPFAGFTTDTPDYYSHDNTHGWYACSSHGSSSCRYYPHLWIAENRNFVNSQCYYEDKLSIRAVVNE